MHVRLVFSSFSPVLATQLGSSVLKLSGLVLVLSLPSPPESVRSSQKTPFCRGARAMLLTQMQAAGGNAGPSSTTRALLAWHDDGTQEVESAITMKAVPVQVHANKIKER